MPLPISTLINSSVQAIYNAATNVKSHYAAPRLSQALDEVSDALGELYRTFPVTVPAAQATLTPLFAGALLTAKQVASVYGGASVLLVPVALQIGDCFAVTSSQDTTNTALLTAKGSAPAAGDVFCVTSVVAPAVSYVGAAVPALAAYTYGVFTA